MRNEKTGKIGFLKAINYTDVFGKPNFPKLMEDVMATYNFECSVLNKCKEKNLDNVVIAIDQGTYRHSDYQFDVLYLIFEMAKGDIRKFIKFNHDVDRVLILKSLHSTAVGLSQLHSVEIAHQDLKPSNILMFTDEESKIADFGRASMTGHTPPHDREMIPGDRGYAPIEQLYGYIPNDLWQRRVCGDLYAFGSLIYHYFTDCSITAALKNEIPLSYHYSHFRNYEEAIPIINHALTKITSEFGEIVDGELSSQLVEMVYQLCNPRLEERGHPLNKNGYQNPFSLERYITKLDILSKKEEILLRRKYE